jgi:hypothetical protein
MTRLRDTPPLLIVQKVLRQIPFRPMDIGKLCFLRLNGPPRVPQSYLRGRGVVRRGTPADLDGLVHLRNQQTVFLDRFSAGDHCVVADVDGRLVGYEWFCVRAVHYESAWGCRIAIPNGFVYAYDAYIDSAFRNAAIWVRFKAYLGDLMTESGRRGVLTFVDYGNWPSLRTHLRFGFTPAATILVVKVLGRVVTLNLATMELSGGSGVVSSAGAISVT